MHTHTHRSGTEMNESCVWHLISRWGFRSELVLSFRGAIGFWTDVWCKGGETNSLLVL